jgi:hypothetical protein
MAKETLYPHIPSRQVLPTTVTGPTSLKRWASRGGKRSKVWIRAGDNAEYESHENPYDAGCAVGAEILNKPVSFRYVSLGVEINPAFVGNNYVSLFWGDANAQPSRDRDSELTSAEKKQFENGVMADFK